MSEKKTGLAPLPSNLLRPTTPLPDDEAPAKPAAAAPQASNGAQAPAAPAEPEPVKAPRTRRKRAPISTEETKGFKLYLPEDIHDRLKLLAIKKRKRVSAVAAELLDKVLPRWRLEEEP